MQILSGEKNATGLASNYDEIGYGIITKINIDNADEIIRIGDEISDDILFSILENNYYLIDIYISEIKNECLKKKIKKNMFMMFYYGYYYVILPLLAM